jgi:hypothetical protein
VVDAFPKESVTLLHFVLKKELNPEGLEETEDDVNPRCKIKIAGREI